MLQELLTAVSLLLLLACSLEAGFRLGRRAAVKRGSPGGSQVGAIQGATLGLLGLLLGFSFAGAASRFMERQDLIVQEANAIGTAYRRADMLDEPHRNALRTELARYVEHRISLLEGLSSGLSPEAVAEIGRFHDSIWKAASAGVAAKPEYAEVVLPPVNDVIDLQTSRVAAGSKHLPPLLIGLLVGCSSLSMIGIGYGCGLSGTRCLMMTGFLGILIVASLWMTIDLDHPRVGLIQLNDGPLLELRLDSDQSPPGGVP